MRISKIATLLMIVGFATLSQAVHHKQAGIKSLLSNAAATEEPDVVLECAGKGTCGVQSEKPSCGCDHEDDGPEGTVSVSVGSSESYNCNDSAFTTFNFPTIDDYQRSGLADQGNDDYPQQKPRNRCRQQPVQPIQPLEATPYVAARPRSEQCKENVRRPIGANRP